MTAPVFQTPKKAPQIQQNTLENPQITSSQKVDKTAKPCFTKIIEYFSFLGLEHFSLGPVNRWMRD